MFGQSLISGRTTSAIRQAIRRFILGDDGIALVEFTIFTPILIVMSIYIMDFGLYFFNKLEMQNAAQAGTQWAIATGLYNDSDIQVAAKNAVPAMFLPTQIYVTTNEFCGCPSSTRVALYDSTKPSGICPSGVTCVVGTNTEAAGNYVTVTATTVSQYKSFIPYGLFSIDPDITGTSTVRIQ
jgi:Flp pilus assembly protein TadG